MYITCPACNYDRNPKDAQFCEACGSDLNPYPAPIEEEPEANYGNAMDVYPPPPPPTQVNPPEVWPNKTSPQPVPSYPEPPFVSYESSASSVQTARLISKQPGSPLPEFVLDSSNAIIGRFDPDTGPVEVDLDGFYGADTISRQHGEIYIENGQWKIKDLGSTNGIFIKPVGTTRFGARITTPQPLNSGDEIAIGKIRLLFQTP